MSSKFRGGGFEPPPSPVRHRVWVLVYVEGWNGPTSSIATHQNPVLKGLGTLDVLGREAYQDSLHVAYCKPVNEQRTPLLARVREHEHEHWSARTFAAISDGRSSFSHIA